MGICGPRSPVASEQIGLCSIDDAFSGIVACLHAYTANSWRTTTTAVQVPPYSRWGGLIGKGQGHAGRKKCPGTACKPPQNGSLLHWVSFSGRGLV